MSSAPTNSYVSVDDSAYHHFVDTSGFYDNTTTPPDSHLLSPYSNFQSLGHSVSPSQHTHSTPAELSPDNGDYSGLSDLDDEFYGIDIDVGQQFTNLNLLDFEHAQPGTTVSPQLALGIPTFEHQRKLSSETRSSAATQYPPSPNPTSSPSPHTTPPTLRVHENRLTDFSVANMDANSSHHFQDHSGGQGAAPYQPTPDFSSSSQTSIDTFPAVNPHTTQQSPRVLVSQWGAHDQSMDSFTAEPSAYDDSFDDGQASTRAGPYQSLDSLASSDVRTGLDPDTRQALGDSQVPNFKEQERAIELDRKNRLVDSWVTQTNKPASHEGPRPSIYSLAPPTQRQRAKSTSAVNNAYAESPFGQPHPGARLAEDDGGIKPLSEVEKPTENKLIEGQLYFDVTATEIKPSDIEEIRRIRKWEDPPRVPYITTSKTQASTANEAISAWNTNADTFSLLSRSATWGTRRKSEPNLAELTQGGLLKRLTISNKNRPRQSSFLKNIVPKRDSVSSSTKNKLKRSLSNKDNKEMTPMPATRKDSSSSLAPPPRTSSFGRSKTPSLNTQIAAMAVSMSAIGGASHARSASIGAGADLSQTTSPKSPIGFAQSLIRRARSRSDLGRDRDEQSEGLVGLWRGQGGPPVPNLTTPAAEQPKLEPPKAQDFDDHDPEADDDDDDYGDDNDLQLDDMNAPAIVPTYPGFRDHVLRLNPKIGHSYLVDRIAHQQLTRYKNLLQNRVKHSQSVNDRSCSSGVRCISMGGTHCLLDAKGNPKETPLSAGGLHITTDFSDGDSNLGDGMLLPDSFPSGVPMPPTPCLPAEFECQLCFKVKKFQKPSDWTKHVQEDVQPFTCTYYNCKESKSFKRKADWVRHENERHRHLEWWTCQVDDCSHQCFRKDNFLQHLVREHKLPEPKAKTKAAVKKTRGGNEDEVWLMLERCHHITTNLPKDEPCKFCGKEFTTWKKLTVHLAKHMEQIALPVLKLVEQKEVDHTTVISPIESGRQGPPATPVAMKEADPAGLMDISPPAAGLSSQYNPAYNTPAVFYPQGAANAQMSFAGMTALSQDGGIFGSNDFAAPFDPMNSQIASQPRGFSSQQFPQYGNAHFPTTQGLSGGVGAYAANTNPNIDFQNQMMGISQDQFQFRGLSSQQPLPPQQQLQSNYGPQIINQGYPATTLPEYTFPGPGH